MLEAQPMPTADRGGGTEGTRAMSIHEQPTDHTFVQRTARAVVPFVTAFFIALVAAKVVSLVTDNGWTRLATAVGVAVISLLFHPYENDDERPGP